MDGRWLDLPASHFSLAGTIRLRKKTDTDPSQVLQSLRDGTCRSPFVHDDGEYRSLHFDFRSTQSSMLIRDPDKLTFAYTRKMASFLIFKPDPREIVIVGLGGGSLTRFCLRALPDASITTVEINDEVIALSELFGLPEIGVRHQLVCADATTYFATTSRMADVVLVDGCDRRGTARAFCEPRFYEILRARLRAKGLLSINLIGPRRIRESAKAAIANTFSDDHIKLQLSAGGNELLFVFSDANYSVDWLEARFRAAELAIRYGINFPDFVGRMQRHALER